MRHGRAFYFLTGTLPLAALLSACAPYKMHVYCEPFPIGDQGFANIERPEDLAVALLIRNEDLKEIRGISWDGVALDLGSATASYTDMKAIPVYRTQVPHPGASSLLIVRTKKREFQEAIVPATAEDPSRRLRIIISLSPWWPDAGNDVGTCLCLPFLVPFACLGLYHPC